MKNKKVYSPNRRGITFIEAIINIYVYVIIIVVCTSVAITYVKGRSAIRQKQQAVEEISLAIGEITKIARMSSCPEIVAYTCVTGGNSKTLNIDPNEENAFPIEYEITEVDGLKGLYVNGNLMMERVDGNFYSTRDGDQNEIPLITIELWKLDREGNEINDTRTKTSVSMRSGYE